MKNLVFILSIGTLLISCQPENRVFNEQQELSTDLQWNRDDIKSFSVPVSDTTKLHDLSISFRYAEGFQHNTVLIKVIETAPSGTQREQIHELKIKDENGEYLGDPAYDIWDSEHLIEENTRYKETGVYQYRIKHAMSNDPLHYAMEIGLIIDSK